MPAPISSKYFIIFFNEKEYAVKKKQDCSDYADNLFLPFRLKHSIRYNKQTDCPYYGENSRKKVLSSTIFFYLNARTSSFNFVSHSPHSLDILWILCRIIHLISQMSDVNHNCIRTVHKIPFSPHFLKQFFRIHNFTTILT